MSQVAKLQDELRALGVVQYDLLLPETQALPSVLHPNEQIRGIVYGRYKQITRTKQGGGGETIGRGALVATNQRVFLLDKKPLFTKCAEITYEEIRAVTYTRVALAGTVTLHMEVVNLNIRTFNHNCARHFVDAVEANIFKPLNH